MNHNRSTALEPFVLKELSSVIASAVIGIFKNSLDDGEIPSDWKKDQTCSLYMKGEKRDPVNYRLISLTCILCKTMEHNIASSITLIDNILYDLQHGFRERMPCQTQLIQLVENLARNLTSGTQIDLLYTCISYCISYCIQGLEQSLDSWAHSYLLS